MTVDEAVDWLRSHASEATRTGLTRFAIPNEHALGVAVKDIRTLGKKIGRDHPLALALWDTRVYEARMLTAFVADPERLTPAQMDRFVRDFDSWAICDTLCFSLFDRTPHAWDKVRPWSRRRKEFEKRTAFALLWSLALHDERAPDERFLEGLAVIEAEAGDGRNFVKKAVNMALRAIGKRNRGLHAAATEVAQRLASANERAAAWVGRDALRELQKKKKKS